MNYENISTRSRSSFTFVRFWMRYASEGKSERARAPARDRIRQLEINLRYKQSFWWILLSSLRLSPLRLNSRTNRFPFPFLSLPLWAWQEITRRGKRDILRGEKNGISEIQHFVWSLDFIADRMYIAFHPLLFAFHYRARSSAKARLTQVSRWIIYGYMLPSKRKPCVSVATTHQLFRRSWIKSNEVCWEQFFYFFWRSLRRAAATKLYYGFYSTWDRNFCATLSPDAAKEKKETKCVQKKRERENASFIFLSATMPFWFFKENSFSARRSVECSQTRIYAKIMAHLESSSASCHTRRRRGRSFCQMQKLCLSHASFDAKIVFNERESDECK